MPKAANQTEIPTQAQQRAGTRAGYLREEVEALIVEGELQAGERLDESELAKRFGMSRTPVREALKSLLASGLVEMRGRQGVFVAKPSISSLLEMFELMAVLEGICASCAARRSTPAQREELRETHEELVAAFEAKDPDRFYQVNIRFHDLICAASKTTFIAEQTMNLRRRLAPYRMRVTFKPDRMRASLAEHLRIIEAIENADYKEASAAASDHLRLLGDDLSDLLAVI